LFFADASTDRVGIGTATPSQKLDVRGDVNISGNYYGNGSTLTGLSGDNSSWNKTYADTLYADISVVDTDTWWSIDNDYLDNVSDVLTFDETVLNSTIDARASSFTYDDYFNQDLNTTDSPSFANIYMDDYLRHTSDVGSNTYLWMGEDQYSFVVGGYNFLKLGEAGTSSEVVFNEDSNTIGYRFETDTYQSALSINALSGQIRMSNLSSCTNIESDVSGFLSCGSGSSFTYDDYFDQYLNTTDNVSFQNIVLGNHSVIYTEERATGNEGGEFGWNSEGESYILYLYDGVNEATITPNSIEVNGDAVFTTLDTGQGANELYEMDQNVLTTSTPSFAGANMTDNNVTDVDCIVFTSGGQICSGS